MKNILGFISVIVCKAAFTSVTSAATIATETVSHSVSATVAAGEVSTSKIVTFMITNQ